MRRRKFLGLLSGAVVLPYTAHAQQTGTLRRIAVLVGAPVDDPQGRAIVAALSRGFQSFGWVDGRNTKIFYRGASNRADLQRYARELLALSPDVAVATGGTSAGPLLEAAKSVPVVFANVPDPVGSGFIESLSRPGGNATGFVQFEYNLSGKWPELLKQIAPNAKTAAVLWDPTIIAGVGQFAVIQSVAPSLDMDLRAINVRDNAEIERLVGAFANLPNGAMIVTASSLALVHRDLIVRLAARHKLPTIYFQRVFVAEGGLISYGANFFDQYVRAAEYVDRILKGEKAGDLPVQAPLKYELVINLKAASALGQTVPPTLLARADEVIE
jgi:putative ABC transport system substrate-binding protein